MTTEILATPDITALSATLKKRIEACGNSVGKHSRKPSVLLPADLKHDLLEAIDLLVSQAQLSELQLSELHASGQQNSEQNNPEQNNRETTAANPLAKEVDQALCGLIHNTLDESLAAWQAQIVSSFEQSAARELHQQLALSTQLSSDLTRQTQHIEEQRRFLEAELAQTLNLRARLSRQRKSLAQHFRSQRAEIAAQIASRESETTAAWVQERDAQSQQIAALQVELARCQQQNVGSEQQLNSTQQQLSTTEQHLASAEQELANKREQLTNAENQLANAETKLTHTENQLIGTTEQLTSTTEQLSNAQQRLAEAQQLLEGKQDELSRELEQAGSLHAQQDELLAVRDRLQAAEEARLATQKLYDELLSAQATTPSPESLAQHSDEIDVLEQRLYDQQLELLDLRAQNSDLASQVAKHQITASSVAPHVSFNQESLSWEERKKLIMQQLDADAAAEEADETTVLRHLEVEDILATTQKEIERRDREIEELQSIIEQQSSARDGVAIGAAAIAQMLDADDLVNQERQKLKKIQREWEDKLRQAEIDLSMERAKLARERSQLETELEQARKSATTPTVEIEGQTKAQARTRKWLEHLGLKEARKHED